MAAAFVPATARVVAVDAEEVEEGTVVVVEGEDEGCEGAGSRGV